MSSKLYTAALVGLDSKIVEVEVDYRRGNTYFSVVGLADKSIQEAKDRIPAAIKNAGGSFTPMKIVMNLAPAELSKSGPSYDLPLALGYLIASNQLDFDPLWKLFLGELALDGRLRSISGVLPIVSAAKKLGFKEIFIPYSNRDEAALVPDIDIFPVRDLREIMDHLNDEDKIEPYERSLEIKEEEIIYQHDFSEVKGQVMAKRAMEIAAAGNHNILLHGVPGSGKSLLSKCLPSILPNMSFEESLEVMKIYSVAGLTKTKKLIKKRPFRSPHHTLSQTALVGGGGKISPGEISMAHRGVLFLDEFPEFTTYALEALRQPLEDKVVTISRASGSVTFPANFMLVAAMNPCKCGYLGDEDKDCSCTSQEIQRYQKKISGPILDRIDLLVRVSKVKHSEFFDANPAEKSIDIKARVQNARDIQLKRFKGKNLYSNSEMSQKDIKEHIEFSKAALDMLKLAVKNMNLTARSFFRIQKVARTIADLAGADIVEEIHVAEALQFRVGL